MKKKFTLSDAVEAIEAAGFRVGGDLVSVHYRLSPWSGGLFVTSYPGDKSDGDRKVVSFTVDDRGRVSKADEFAASLAEAIERHKALRGAGRRADRDSKAA
jgi:hypothetical protein